jgi:hypothetical protein
MWCFKLIGGRIFPDMLGAPYLRQDSMPMDDIIPQKDCTEY